MNFMPNNMNNNFYNNMSQFYNNNLLNSFNQMNNQMGNCNFMDNENNMNFVNNNINNANNFFNNMNGINNFNNLSNNIYTNINIYQNFSFSEIIKISEQTENCICEMGFFCIFPYESKTIKVYITRFSEDFIKDGQIYVYLNNKNKNLCLYLNNERKIYISQNNDLLIIEIKDTDDINNFLELDEEFINKKNKNTMFDSNSIYILYESHISYGLYQYLNDYEIKILLFNDIFDFKFPFKANPINTLNDYSSYSYCSPILNLENNKVIGVFVSKGKGILLKYLLDEFIKLYNIERKAKKIKQIKDNNNIIIKSNINPDFNKNEIRMKINIAKCHVNNKILLINNLSDNSNLFEKGLEKLDEKDIDIYIDDIKSENLKYFIPTKAGIYYIKIQFNKYLKDCFSMFSDNNIIIDLNLASFDTRNVTNMKEMFKNRV